MKYRLPLSFLAILCSTIVCAFALNYDMDSVINIQIDSAQYPRNLWKPITLKSPDEPNLSVEIKRPKHFWRAGTEWFLAQAFPASFNRFITKDPYSYISFKNFIDHQRISAWDWDDNQFSTDLF